MSTASRLSLAVESGAVALGEGARVVVFAPRAGMDLSALPKDATTVITAQRPDWEAFEAQGWACALAPEGRCDVAVVCATRAKAEAQALVAQAAGVCDGVVVVDGAKTDGIESLLKACRARADVSAPLSKAHGKLFTFAATPEFADWASADLPAIEDDGVTFQTAPGVFSADAVDEASGLLAKALPPKLGAQIADLGAGWGYLSHHILTRDTVKTLHLVEANHTALSCAKANVTDPRAQFHWADVTRWEAPVTLDTVVMNPPFHSGRKGDPSLGHAFIAAAARNLGPRGQLYMVANRHLPYETELSARFAEIEDLGGDGRFKLVRAARPSRARR